jgi:hypothetical protein
MTCHFDKSRGPACFFRHRIRSATRPAMSVLLRNAPVKCLTSDEWSVKVYSRSASTPVTLLSTVESCHSPIEEGYHQAVAPCPRSPLPLNMDSYSLQSRAKRLP